MARRKKEPPKLCSWCGTKLNAIKPGCPRGQQCDRDQSDHHSLLDRMKVKN